MLITKAAMFLHVPKTGGTWVKAAIANAGVEFEEYLVDGDPHGDYSYCPIRDRTIVAFVREPLSLYRSYWRYKMGESKMSIVWDQQNPFDVACAADTFEGFVENVLRTEPGWCSRMFEDYVGPRDAEIGFVGRYESLADDLIRALRITGTVFDEGALRGTAPVNVSTVDPALVRCSDDLARRVRDQERDGIRRFGYG